MPFHGLCPVAISSDRIIERVGNKISQDHDAVRGNKRKITQPHHKSHRESNDQTLDNRQREKCYISVFYKDPDEGRWLKHFFIIAYEMAFLNEGVSFAKWI